MTSDEVAAQRAAPMAHSMRRTDVAQRREQARTLRQQGLSLTEIAQQLGLDRSRVSVLVRDVALSAEQTARLHERVRDRIREGARRSGYKAAQGHLAQLRAQLWPPARPCLVCGRRAARKQRRRRGAAVPFCTDRCAAAWAYAQAPGAAPDAQEDR